MHSNSLQQIDRASLILWRAHRVEPPIKVRLSNFNAHHNLQRVVRRKWEGENKERGVGYDIIEFHTQYA